jgi:hypothetical protein
MTQLRNTLPNLALTEVQLFLAELRAHHRHAEEVLRRWA